MGEFVSCEKCKYVTEDLNGKHCGCCKHNYSQRYIENFAPITNADRIGHLQKGRTMNKGDKVKMNDKYYVNEKNKGKIFTVRTAPQRVGGTLVVWLDDFSGCYAVDGLDVVTERQG